MAIYGIEPLENQNAADAFGTIAYIAEQRIDQWFEKFQGQGLKEPGLVGYVVALRAIAETCPKLARVGCGPERVEEWKAAYQKWIEEFGDQVKVQRGMDRKAIWARAMQEFDALKQVLSRG